jgi:hypothetical protein
MAFQTLTRRTRSSTLSDNIGITIGSEARLSFTRALSQAATNLKATHRPLQYDWDERTLRLKLLANPGNSPDVYKITTAGGKQKRSFAKAALDQIGYNYSTRTTYEAQIDAKQKYVDITLAPEKLTPRP